MKKDAEVLYPDMEEFMRGISMERQALFILLFKRASHLFDELSQREKEMLLYAYVLGANDTEGYVNGPKGDE